jgi:hypothetical protein
MPPKGLVQRLTLGGAVSTKLKREDYRRQKGGHRPRAAACPESAILRD